MVHTKVQPHFRINSDSRAIYWVIQIALAVILLFNPSFKPILLRTTSDESVISGMPPFDLSVIGGILPEDLATETLASVGDLLGDITIAFPYFVPTNYACPSGEGCFSYVLPGGLDEIISNKTSQNITFSLPSDSTWFVAKEVPVYQLEYFSLQEDIIFNETDCRVYASVAKAIEVCLENVGENLIAGIRK